MKMQPFRLVQFYDPHPGLMGCPEPLPDKVKEIADFYNGKTASIEEVIDTILEAVGPESDIEAQSSMILLSLGQRVDWGVRKNNWRVLRFKEIESED